MKESWIGAGKWLPERDGSCGFESHCDEVICRQARLTEGASRLLVRISVKVFVLSSLAISMKAQPSYTISTVAGSDWVGENIAATSSILRRAQGIATDMRGNVYISDSSTHRVRCISPNGNIQTIAGNGIAGFAGDNGPASSSQLNSPYGLAFDFAGNLFIADLGNARVRRITPAGIISTVVGGGSLPAGGQNDGSLASSLAFIAPRNIAIDSTGIIYFSDFGGNRVYKMTTDGTVTTLAGTGSLGYSGDGVALLAKLNNPTALAVDHVGTVYIADTGSHLIRKVSGGMLTSIAHTALPTGLAFDGVATLYVADHTAAQILAVSLSAGTSTALNVSATDIAFGTADSYIYVADLTVGRRVTVFGASTVIAGGGSLAEGDGGPGDQALLNQPSGVALDSIGNLYIADQANNRVRRVALDGTITTLAGNGTSGNAGDGGAAVLANLNAPSSVRFDAYGNLYIADTGNARVRMVTPGGIILPVVTGTLSAPGYLIFDKSQNLYIADSSAIYQVSPLGLTTTLFTGLQSPRGMAFDGSGNFYFAEAGRKQVWISAPSGSISAIASGVWSSPEAIALDASGNLLVADSGLAQVLSVDSSGHVTVIAGAGAAGFGGDGGSSLLAQLSAPSDVCVSASATSGGAIYLADSGNNRVRQLMVNVGAVNAASFSPGPVAPGMLLALTGTGLTSADMTQTQVLFDTVIAPFFSITAGEMLVQAPASLAAKSVLITLTNQGSQIAQIPADVAVAAPALFVNSSGQASATNHDGSLNSPSNPASRGSVISLFGTGEGVSGLPFSVAIAGYTATILYAGPGPYPGVFQVNTQVPSGTFSGGSVPIELTVGTFVIQPGLTINVF
jgi:trimeric autotransporter adhesin